ncbi:MAG: hypothetical protein ACJAZC_002290 [Cryomorphaceae bacterium]
MKARYVAGFFGLQSFLGFLKANFGRDISIFFVLIEIEEFIYEKH